MAHLVGQDGRVLDANEAWLAALGFEREEVTGRLMRDLLETHARDRLLDDAVPLFRLSGAARSIACTLVHRTGTPVDVIADAEMLDALDSGGTSRSLVVATQEAARWRSARLVLRALVDLHQIALVLDQPQTPVGALRGLMGEQRSTDGATAHERARATVREISLETIQSSNEAELACGADDTACTSVTSRVKGLMQAMLVAVDAEAAAAQA